MLKWLSNLVGKPAEDLLDVSEIVEETPPEPRPARANSFMEVVVVTSGGERRKGVAVDISDTGARLRFHTSASMSETVQLKIPQAKIDRMVNVVWHRGIDVGVKFA